MLFLRLAIILITLCSSFVVATDSADARRRFRMGGGSSRTVVVPVVHSRSHNSSGSETATGDGGAPITLVHAMPDTPDYAYGNGYFDVGFRETPDGKGEYVIYSGTYASVLKPELQKGIAGIVGFDPVERHKASRKSASASGSASPAAPQKMAATPIEPSKVPWLSIFFLLGMVGIVVFGLWKRFSRPAEDSGFGTNVPDMETRIDARLRSLRS